MANNCLVTKLKESVSGDSMLPKLNAVNIVFKKGNGNASIGYAGSKTAELEGNGYFSDSTYTQNLGKSITASGSSIGLYVVATDDVMVNVLDVPRQDTTFTVSLLSNCYIPSSSNIETRWISSFNDYDLNETEFDITKLEYPELLKSLTYSFKDNTLVSVLDNTELFNGYLSGKLTGDIKDLKTPLNGDSGISAQTVSGNLEDFMEYRAATGIQCADAYLGMNGKVKFHNTVSGPVRWWNFNNEQFLIVKNASGTEIGRYDKTNNVWSYS